MDAFLNIFWKGALEKLHIYYLFIYSHQVLYGISLASASIAAIGVLTFAFSTLFLVVFLSTLSLLSILGTGRLRIFRRR